MSYVVITEDGEPVVRPGAPSYDRISQDVRGLVESVQVGDEDLLTFVNEDFQALEAAGTLRRNIVGTVLMVAADAPPMPYAGPLVITGVRNTPHEGPEPVILEQRLIDAVVTIVQEIRAVLAGPERTADDWRRLAALPPLVAQQMHEVAVMARTAPYPATNVLVLGEDGSWTRAT